MPPGAEPESISCRFSINTRNILLLLIYSKICQLVSQAAHRTLEQRLKRVTVIAAPCINKKWARKPIPKSAESIARNFSRNNGKTAPGAATAPACD